MPSDEDAELNFSQALQRLEALLAQLESGDCCTRQATLESQSTLQVMTSGSRRSQTQTPRCTDQTIFEEKDKMGGIIWLYRWIIHPGFLSLR